MAILDDALTEGEESFTLVLSNPSPGLLLGATSTAEIVIVDDEGEPRQVYYSVGASTGNMLTYPLGMDIVGGIATFSEDLPEGPDRGDMLVTGEGHSLYLSSCTDDRHCAVVDAAGLPRQDAVGVLVTGIYPAFSSLNLAVWDAADPDHLGTWDLVSANLVLNLVC